MFAIVTWQEIGSMALVIAFIATPIFFIAFLGFGLIYLLIRIMKIDKPRLRRVSGIICLVAVAVLIVGIIVAATALPHGPF